MSKAQVFEAFWAYREGLLSKTSPVFHGLSRNCQFSFLLKNIFINRLGVTERFLARSISTDVSLALTAMRTGSLHQAQSSLTEARGRLKSLRYEEATACICRSFVLSAEAYLEYIGEDWDSAIDSTLRGMDYDLALENLGWDTMCVHRAQSGVNIIRILVKSKQQKEALTLAGEFIAYLEGRRNDVQLHHSWRSWCQYTVPTLLTRAMVAEVASSIAIPLAGGGEDALDQVKRGLEVESRNEGATILEERVRDWLHLKEQFLRRDNESYLESLPGFLRKGRGNISTLWYASIVDFQIFCKTLNSAAAHSIASAILRDSGRWPNAPRELLSMVSNSD